MAFMLHIFILRIVFDGDHVRCLTSVRYMIQLLSELEVSQSERAEKSWEK